MAALCRSALRAACSADQGYDPSRRISLGETKLLTKTGPPPFEVQMTTEFTVEPTDADCRLRVAQDGFRCEAVADDFMLRAIMLRKGERSVRESNHELYEFGPFSLDLVERELLREGAAIILSAKVFDLLKLLVEQNGQTLEKDKLLAELWPDTFVEENSLT
ncbi:MAG: winged helix-turn-helix domain-containing protein, partial [Acidobacteriota bacterium]|nr:winged helix-turn-helix domain-containing protein [Acidobacteriota bacterium]